MLDWLSKEISLLAINLISNARGTNKLAGKSPLNLSESLLLDHNFSKKIKDSKQKMSMGKVSSLT